MSSFFRSRLGKEDHPQRPRHGPFFPSFGLAWMVCAAILLSGCGYQLRGVGATDARLSGLYLENKVGDNQLAYDISRAVTNAGGSMVQDPKAATYYLTLLKVSAPQRVVTTNINGQATEYGVNYTIHYSFRDSLHTSFISQASESGTYPYDPNSPNTSLREERILKKQLRLSAVYNMLNRIDRSLRDEVVKDDEPVDPARGTAN